MLLFLIGGLWNKNVDLMPKKAWLSETLLLTNEPKTFVYNILKTQ